MSTKIKIALRVALVVFALCAGTASWPALPPALEAQTSPTQTAVTRRIGVIKAINGTAITLAPDSGATISVNAQSNTRFLRIAPGEKDLKNASPIALTDLQVGDRILVGGKLSDDGTSLAASSIVAMKAADVEARQQQSREDWQKRGLGGVVDSVDAASGTVNVSIPSLAGKKIIAVHTTSTTSVRRYSPDSIKFEDAKPSSLQQIQQGDQLRARGDRSSDGTQFAAEEILTGTFPYIVGTIKTVDASAGTLTVQDLLSKKAIEVKTTADSQLHKIPPEMAQRFAARLKGTASGGGTSGGAPTGSPASSSGNGQPPSGTTPGGSGAGGTRAGGAPDFQQILSRLPSSTLADLQLQKGDAVVILATQGSPSSASIAITLLSGVEPILQAAPNAGQAMMLTPWSLGGTPGGDTGSQ
jgi:Domain of unknown function (DUF5666)